MLDSLPPRPYKPTADLRELHRLFHEAAKIDEGVLRSPVSIEEVMEMVNSNPTSRKQAIQLTEEINAFAEDRIMDGGMGKVLEILYRTYTRHNPPEKIDHSY